jgi:ABC-type dipeptide/oligopeptide/nickel transport system, ATPase component
VSAPVLKVEELSVIARKGEHEVTLVDRLSFDLAEGEVLGLVGESGPARPWLVAV